MINGIRLTIALFFFFIPFSNLYADDIPVNVKGIKASSRFQAKKPLENAAKREAVKKYILKINKKCDEGTVKELSEEYPNFVEGIKQEEFSFEAGKGSGKYTVSLDTAKLNREMAKAGCQAQGSTLKVVVLEEPPSKAKMQFGSTHVRYTDYQRKILGAIIRKANETGLVVKPLADMPEFREFKTEDETLVGVYYDVDSADFKINRGLMEKVRATLPGVVAIYYHIDSLYFDPKSKTMTAELSIFIKSLDSGERKDLGSRSYTVNQVTDTPEGKVHAFSIAAENATALLMNKARDVVNSLLMASSNKPSVVTILHGAKSDLYKIKKELEKNGAVASCSTAEGQLLVNLKKGASLDDFLYDSLAGIFEKLKFPFEDKNITIEGKDAKIRF